MRIRTEAEQTRDAIAHIRRALDARVRKGGAEWDLKDLPTPFDLGCVLSAVTELRDAVQGCGRMYRVGAFGSRCGDHSARTLYLCGECAVQRDAAITALLDGRTP